MDGSHEMFIVKSFILLKPEKVGFFELLRAYNGIQERDCVHCHNDVDVEDHKWLIFVSLVTQKFLHLVANRMKSVGHTIELCLNYNVFMLLSNYLRGKEVDTASANYMSIIGHLDKRIELDSSIKREDPKYKVMLSMMASKASYENKAFLRAIVEDHWKMELVEECKDYWNYYQDKATTQAFILLDKRDDQDTYVVAFRGTEPFDADAWSTDVDFSWLELPGVGKIHAGFMKALGLQEIEVNVLGWPKEIKTNEKRPYAYYTIRGLLKKLLDGNDKAKFIFTGHSLGGALAILFPAILMLHDETFLLERLEGVFTFGQPRVGDKEFAEYMKTKLKDNHINYYRFAYNNDIVPRLPFDDNEMMFKHFGTCLYYDRSYICEVMDEVPNKNYFSLLESISMSVNAFWELVRSFTIVYKYGFEYQEGWLLRFFRLVGLVFPGFTDHMPQDYVNVTRLGKFPPNLD